MSTTFKTTEPPKRGRGRPPKGARALSSTDRSRETRIRQSALQYRIQLMAAQLLELYASENPQMASQFFYSSNDKPCVADLLREMVGKDEVAVGMLDRAKKMVKQAEANRDATAHQTETDAQKKARAVD